MPIVYCVMEWTCYSALVDLFMFYKRLYFGKLYQAGVLSVLSVGVHNGSELYFGCDFTPFITHLW